MICIRQFARRSLLAGAALLSGAAAQAAIPIQHWTLANGAKVDLAATNALPIVDVQVDFDAGGRRDPTAQAGLATVSAEMVEKGIRANGSDPALCNTAARVAQQMKARIVGLRVIDRSECETRSCDFRPYSKNCRIIFCF